MPKNVEDLREQLFDTITALKDKDNPMDIERAKAIANVGQVIINTAKAEVDFINKVGGTTATKFFDPAGVTRHRIS